MNGLEDQVSISNQTLKADESAYRNSQALVRVARASYFPTVTADASVTRSGSGSGGQTSVNSGTTTTTVTSRSKITNVYDASLGASWDIDIWGKIRRSVESDVATAQASAATLASARLSEQGLLASDYFALRVLDEEIRLYDSTIAAYQRSYELVQNQYTVGVVGKADVLTAQTQLQSAEAAGTDLATARAQYEHAIAVLIGKPPATFSIAPEPFKPTIPPVPAQLPSDLLQRRPDIAAQERTIAAANAQIGVAVAAYYPDLTLTSSIGFESTQFEHWLEAPFRVWSLGPQLAETLIDFGARRGQVASARALYDEDVANYRQTVLTAFQAVEDQLVALATLTREQLLQDAATQSSLEAVELTLNEYKAGTVDYSSVVTAQTTALGNQRSQLAVIGNRLAASVSLIEALGGGWEIGELPAKP